MNIYMMQNTDTFSMDIDLNALSFIDTPTCKINDKKYFTDYMKYRFKEETANKIQISDNIIRFNPHENNYLDSPQDWKFIITYKNIFLYFVNWKYQSHINMNEVIKIEDVIKVLNQYNRDFENYIINKYNKNVIDWNMLSFVIFDYTNIYPDRKYLHDYVLFVQQFYNEMKTQYNKIMYEINKIKKEIEELDKEYIVRKQALQSKLNQFN